MDRSIYIRNVTNNGWRTPCRVRKGGEEGTNITHADFDGMNVNWWIPDTNTSETHSRCMIFLSFGTFKITRKEKKTAAKKYYIKKEKVYKTKKQNTKYKTRKNKTKKKTIKRKEKSNWEKNK